MTAGDIQAAAATGLGDSGQARLAGLAKIALSAAQPGALDADAWEQGKLDRF